jgi:hypothetical protein
MLALAKTAPGRALYFGHSGRLEENGEFFHTAPVSWKNNWRELDITKLADECFVMFPGQLFRIADAQTVGGFRHNSYLTGDWDLWFRLALRFGAAQTATEVSTVRQHCGVDRGSTRIERKGWKWALDNVQRKRNLALLQREKGIVIPFERTKLLKQSPIPSRLLLRYAMGFSQRILAYDTWLFLHSTPPNARYAILQWLVRMFRPQLLQFCSFFLDRRRR